MSQWISVKERLPEPSKSVLLALTRTGAILLGDALREQERTEYQMEIA